MSGGHFDYAQYRIDDIISSIEREIERATCKRTPLVTKEGVAVWNITDRNRKQYCSHYNFRSFESAIRYFNDSTRFSLLVGCEREGEKAIRYQDLVTNETYEVHLYTYQEHEPDEDGEIPYYPDYTPETLAEFRKGIEILKKASVYAQRIDWLISGNDGEDSFHERLEEDLKDLEEV